MSTSNLSTRAQLLVCNWQNCFHNSTAQESEAPLLHLPHLLPSPSSQDISAAFWEVQVGTWYNYSSVQTISLQIYVYKQHHLQNNIHFFLLFQTYEWLLSRNLQCNSLCNAIHLHSGLFWLPSPTWGGGGSPLAPSTPARVSSLFGPAILLLHIFSRYLKSENPRLVTQDAGDTCNYPPPLVQPTPQQATSLFFFWVLVSTKLYFMHQIWSL